MNGSCDGPVFRSEHLAAVLREAKLRPQQILSSGRSQTDDHLRLHGLDLRFEPGAASCYFERIRFFVEPDLAPGFPLEMLHGVGDVHLAAINSGGFQALIQKQSGWPDKRPALLIFTIAWLLSYEKHGGMRPALAENDLSGPLIQVATMTMRGCLFQARKIMALGQILQGRPRAGVKQVHCTLMMQVRSMAEIVNCSSF